jgi:hypothetical protein
MRHRLIFVRFGNLALINALPRTVEAELQILIVKFACAECRAHKLM